jgi:hypothetical protein
MIRTLAFVFAAACFAHGQNVTASISGTVTDRSSAAASGVAVTARSVDTNLTYRATTNEAGVYNLLFLPIGSYEVIAEAPGFKKLVAGPFQLEVNQRARVDLTLEVGSVTESVEVRDLAPILQAESAATGDTLSSLQVSRLPLNGRNIANLTLLMPGAITPNPQSLETPGRATGGGRPYINGNREQTNNFSLDGQEVGESVSNIVGYNPSVDAIGEVRVVTGNAGAEFGNASGGNIVMSLKSGSNRFRGNVFYLLRDDALDANGFFNNRTGAGRRDLARHTFGATFGGPIIKDRHFFFADFEGMRQDSSGPSSANVATSTLRQGDLSVFPRPFTDPAANGAPFPGNRIPSSRIVNPVARAIFGDNRLYPLPNNPGVGPIGVTGNYLASSASFVNNDQGDVKVDSRLSAKDNVSGRYTQAKYRTGTGSVALPVFVASDSLWPTYSTVTTWTRTFSPTIVNEARFGYLNLTSDGVPTDPAGLLGNSGNERLGIPGGQPVPGASRVQLGEGLSDVGGVASYGATDNHTLQYGDIVTWQRGRHLLKGGGQALRYIQNRFFTGNNGALGRFDYTGRYTSNAYADFLLNLLSAKGRGSTGDKWRQRSWRLAFFLQDDWKIKPNLTLNIGLRWEWAQPIYEAEDRQTSVDLVTGRVLFAGRDGASRALYRSYPYQYMPRIGFAWTPGLLGGKTVIRGAYGITSFLEGTGTNLRLPLNPPFFFESDVTYALNAPGDIRTGFVDVRPQDQFAGQVRAWNPDLRPAFTQQWNLSIERQVTSRLSATVAYVGQRGTHLINAREYNQPLPDPGPVNTWRPINNRRPLFAVAPAITNISGTDSSSQMNYHSLQASLRQRFGGGLELLASYTLSRTLSDSIGFYGSAGTNNEGAYWQNAYDRLNNYGPAFFDALHSFSTGVVYELPFGRGRRFGANWNRAADALLGGWSIESTLRAHTGFPVTIQVNDTTNQAVRGGTRPNRYRPLQLGARDVDAWFGPGIPFCGAGVDNGSCAYGVPPNGVFGNAAVGTERAPGFFNLNASMGKRFPLSESRYFEFRGEFFNLPNSVSYGPPGRNISSPGTFGAITAQTNSPRNIQLTWKFFF